LRRMTSAAFFLVSSIFFQVFISSCLSKAIRLASSWASRSTLKLRNTENYHELMTQRRGRINNGLIRKSANLLNMKLTLGALCVTGTHSSHLSLAGSSRAGTRMRFCYGVALPFRLPTARSHSRSGELLAHRCWFLAAGRSSIIVITTEK
jgi:hypothetical protein